MVACGHKKDIWRVIKEVEKIENIFTKIKSVLEKYITRKKHG